MWDVTEHCDKWDQRPMAGIGPLGGFEYDVDVDFEQYGDIIEEVMSILEDGDSRGAVKAIRRALEDNPDMDVTTQLRFLKLIVEIYGVDGDYINAQLAAAEAVEAAVNLLGPRDPFTIVLRSSHLYWQCMVGNLNATRKAFPYLIRDAKKVFGPLHSVTIAIRNNSAMPSKLSGNYGRVALIYSRIVADLEAGDGYDRRIYLSVLWNYAEVLSVLERFDEALDVYRRLEGEVVDFCGDGSEPALRVSVEREQTRFMRGERKSARQNLVALYEECCESLGVDATLSMQTCLVLIGIYLHEDNRTEALRYCHSFLDSGAQDLSDQLRRDMELLIQSLSSWYPQSA